MPTRNARNGQLFTSTGKVNIRNAKYKNDFSEIDSNSASPMSKSFSKAYLHHLFKINEVLGLRIATQHNLYFYTQLMKTMRMEILNDNFTPWSRQFLDLYEGGES